MGVGVFVGVNVAVGVFVLVGVSVGVLVAVAVLVDVLVGPTGVLVAKPKPLSGAVGVTVIFAADDWVATGALLPPAGVLVTNCPKAFCGAIVKPIMTSSAGTIILISRRIESSLS